MPIAVETPYIAVGAVIVWVALFSVLWVNELRSEREDTVAAAFMLATVIVSSAIILIILMIIAAWLSQIYLPIFG